MLFMSRAILDAEPFGINQLLNVRLLAREHLLGSAIVHVALPRDGELRVQLGQRLSHAIFQAFQLFRLLLRQDAIDALAVCIVCR